MISNRFVETGLHTQNPMAVGHPSAHVTVARLRLAQEVGWSDQILDLSGDLRSCEGGIPRKWSFDRENNGQMMINQQI